MALRTFRDDNTSSYSTSDLDDNVGTATQKIQKTIVLDSKYALEDSWRLL